MDDLEQRFLNLSSWQRGFLFAVYRHAKETTQTGDIRDGHNEFKEVEGQSFQVVCAICGHVFVTASKAS